MVFNHQVGVETAYTLRLQDGEEFSVSIANTCPQKFAYEVRGIRREAPQPTPRSEIRSLPPLSTKNINVVHSDSYGGYVVVISVANEEVACATGNGGPLESKTFIIFTPEPPDWNVSMSGGFTISGLIDPVYAIKPHPTTPGDKQLVEHIDRRDSANLGLAAFVNTYHERVPWIGPSFGLGVRGTNETEYYVGGGVRLSDKTTINFGAVFGPVAQLPATVSLGETVNDENVLTTLPTRIERSWFIGFSYSFIAVGTRIQQPFAGSGGGGS